VSDGLGAAQPDPDSDGCLCVVASFASAARPIDEVTAEAARRAMMSPVLSDFIEFRFADLGPQPGPDADRSGAIRRITDALLHPQGIAGRNYFALVVVHRSAAVIDQVFSDCAVSPFLTELRIRSLGIANSDDRPDQGQARQPRSLPELMTSPTGIWSRKEDLVDVLRQFAGELQRDYSARHKPGLSIDELGDLRRRYQEHQTQQAVGAETSPTVVAPGPARALDVLAGDPLKARRQEAEQEAVASEPEPAEVPESAGRPVRVRRWVPDLLRRRDQPPEAGELADRAEDVMPQADGLVYLLVVGDESCRDEAALNRSRSALLEVDKKLAELPGFAYQVRMLHGDEDELRGDLRAAGELGRRDIRRTVASVDFAAVLENVRTSLKRDRATLSAPGASTSPAVVFFTPEPPLADTGAAELFDDLAREASVVWVLPKSAKALLSETFTCAPGVRVILDDQAVADEVAALLSSGADAAVISR
jgi:hypothetical protein